MTDDPLAPLLAALRAALAWLGDSGVPAAIVGGVAASIQGRPRVTKDIDFVAMLDFDELEPLLAAAAGYGIGPRHDDVVEFARITRVLLLRHDASSVELDVSLGALPFERELVEACVRVDVEGVTLPVARPEDLVIMKAVAASSP